MDLKHFKILSEADDSFHISSPNGKSFTMLKSEMTPKAHEAVKKMYSGGKVQKFADKGLVESEKQSTDQNYINDLANSPTIEANQSTGEAAPIPESTEGKGARDLKALLSDLPDKPNDIIPGVSPAPVQQTNVEIPTPVQTAQPTEQAIPQQITQATQMNSQLNPADPNNPDFNSGLKSANTKLGKAEAEKDTAVGDTIENSLQDYEELPTPQEAMEKYEDSKREYIDKLRKNEIKPSAAWDNMGTGNKILTSIGLLLHGGLGQMFNTIATGIIPGISEQDIQAQKANQEKTMNLYKMNRENSRTDAEAALKTRAQHLETIQYEVNKQIANSSAPIDIAKVNLINAQLDQNRKQLAYEYGAISPNQGNTNGNLGGTEQARTAWMQNLGRMATLTGNPHFQAAYKEAQDRTLPGQGTFDEGPIPSKEQKDRLSHSTELMKLATEMKAFQQTGPGSSLLRMTPNNQRLGAAYIGRLRGLAPTLMSDTKRFNPGLADSLTAGITSPASWDVWGSNSDVIDNLINFANQNHSDAARETGLNPFKTAPEDKVAITKAVNTLKLNPHDANAIKTLQLNGLR